MSDPYTIAAWRFEQIAPLIDPSLDSAARRAALRQRCRQAQTWPSSAARQRRGLAAQYKAIPKATLYRWLANYRRQGYAGLLPQYATRQRTAQPPEHSTWVVYAVALMYEQPERSLTQLEVYLHAQFLDYNLSRSTLWRRLNTHPAFPGIDALRQSLRRRPRDAYQAQYPHEGWQLDAKGPFGVSFTDAQRVDVHVFSIIDDHSRAILGVKVSTRVDTAAAIAVFESAVNQWGLPERIQFDLGGAFESKLFRQGLAQLGIHRNAAKPRTPQWQGKIEAYHRSLGRWFVNELKAQEVVDLVHLQQLLEAMIALLYQPHYHRAIDTTPEQALAARCSPRRVSVQDLEAAFLVTVKAKAEAKTGRVNLPNGVFRVAPAYAGSRCTLRYHPLHLIAFLDLPGQALLPLQPFILKPLAAVPPQTPASGTGQLQKLLDRWRGQERPNAQSGFGLPEVFQALAPLLGRALPESEREARCVLGFYQQYGPLPREPFTRACERAAQALGPGRPLQAYLDYLQRQIEAVAAAVKADLPDA